MSSNKGFTLVEVIIASFVLSVIVVGVFSLLLITVQASHDGQRKIVATGIGNEIMEQVRNLPYDDVGTVSGVPAGPIAQSSDVTRNGDVYTVTTDIRYIDDSYDSVAPTDTVNTDYKQARVEVTWISNVTNRSVLLVTTIAPKNIEGGSSLGTLIFQALDSSGVGVPSASVHLVNSAVSPAIDLSTSTDVDGQLIVPGLPVSSGTYELTVSKSGYTTEQTYSSSASFFPDVDHSHLTSIAGSVTNKTFSIDAASSLTLNTVDELNAALGGIAYTLVGTKKIGTDASSNSVYLFDHSDTTDGSGVFSYTDMTWDSYTLTVDGAVTGYDIAETSVPAPIVVAPGTSDTVTVTLAPHTDTSLHEYVLDALGQPIPDASVQLTDGGAFDETLTTGATGQVFFSGITANGDYTLNVTATGYQAFTSTVTVTGTTQNTVNLVAS